MHLIERQRVCDVAVCQLAAMALSRKNQSRQVFAWLASQFAVTNDQPTLTIHFTLPIHLLVHPSIHRPPIHTRQTSRGHHPGTPAGSSRTSSARALTLNPFRTEHVGSFVTKPAWSSFAVLDLHFQSQDGLLLPLRRSPEFRAVGLVELGSTYRTTPHTSRRTPHASTRSSSALLC
jgi:hypothetical protein